VSLPDFLEASASEPGRKRALEALMELVSILEEWDGQTARHSGQCRLDPVRGSIKPVVGRSPGVGGHPGG